MSNNILIGNEAKLKLLKGVETLYEAVSTTLGPRGRNVAIDYEFEHKVIHDGVTVARSIQPKDKTEFLGVKIVAEAAKKQVDVVGDGTTVVIILARNLITEAQKIIATGVNPMSLRKVLEEDAQKAIKYLDTLSTPVDTLQKAIHIATISAEDPSLGKMIAETIWKTGTEGVVTVEESKGSDTYVEHQEGLQLDRGYASPYFITDPFRMDSTIENGYVLVTDQPLSDFTELVPFFDTEFLPHSKFITIIAPDFTGDVLPSLILNKQQGKFMALCVRVSMSGDNRSSVLNDIAALTGATLISKDTGLSIRDLKFSHLGKADRVVATKDATVISGGQGDKKVIDERIASIRTQLDDETIGDYDKSKLRERLAKLQGGVAVIKVGGHTEVEMKERKERAIDAVEATKAAMTAGIVPGGEVIYLKLRDQVDSLLFKKALESPFYKLIENAGIPLDSIFTDKNWGKNNYGVDVIDGKVKDLLKSGIIDPVLVAKNAIQNAVSVAVSVITTDISITPEVKETK